MGAGALSEPSSSLGGVVVGVGGEGEMLSQLWGVCL